MIEKPPLRLKFKDVAPVSRDATSCHAARGAPTPPTPPKPRPPTAGTETLIVKCGHKIAFELYVKDTFRDQRRAKTVTRDCPACRQERVQAEAIALKERRAKKAVTFAKALKPRLPDGSHFAATYDATQVQWAGVLTIEGVAFKRGASSLNKLLHKLDDDYRAWKSVQAAPQDPTAVSP